MKTLIKNGTIVNEGKQQKADILIVNDRIEEIIYEGTCNDAGSFYSVIDKQNAEKCDYNIDAEDYDRIIDAKGCYVLPGIIDAHVHFREPGLTHKADMESESRAAAYGGVTSVFEMPNTNPQTTTLEALHAKEEMAKDRMHVNYAFFPGATNDNIEELRKLDRHSVPGIKLFMGSSTGNMLVDKGKALEDIFHLASEMNMPLMAHCEDTETINRNMAYYKEKLGTEDPAVTYHPLIRDWKACYKSSAFAAELARKHNTRLHIAHLTTEDELSLLMHNATLDVPAEGCAQITGEAKNNEAQITGEATVAHLLFSVCDYDTLGARIKCNPSVKSINDQLALRKALADGTLSTIGTDHAPHTLEEKEGGAAKAMSGMPMIQFSLVAMLSIVDEGDLSIEQMVTLMAHNPARLFSVNERGFLRKGYKADIAIVKREDTPWTVTKDVIQSKCRWSPLEGQSFNWKVKGTIINGKLVFDGSSFDNASRGEHITFR